MASANKMIGSFRDGLSWLAIGMAAVLVAASVCSGADCRQFFSTSYGYQYNAQLVAPVVAYAPAVVYQAGQGIEARALIAKEVRAELAKALPQIVAQLKSGQPEQQAATKSAIAQHCGKCHSGAEPKAGVTLDGLAQLTGDQIAASLEQIRDGAMPKDHKLPEGAASAIMNELLNLRQRPAAPPPPIPGDLE